MRSLGVYARSVALVLSVSVPPVLILGAVLVDRNQHALRVDADHHHVLLAERARVEVLRALDGVARALEHVGEATLQAPIATPSEQQHALDHAARALAEAKSVLSFVTFYDSDGVRAATVRAAGADEGEGPATLPFALMQEGHHVGAVSGTHVPFAVAIEWAEKRRWVYTDVELSVLGEQLSALGRLPPLRDSGAVAVVDQSHRVIAGQSPGSLSPVFDALGGDVEFFNRDLSIATEFTDNERPMLGAVVTISQLGWAVVVKRPLAQAYESLAQLRLVIAIAVAAAVLTALLATLIGARWLTTPIRLLNRATTELAERRFSMVDPRVTSRADELGVLGRSFAQMVVSLAVAEKQMLEEARVRAALSRFLAPELVERLVHEKNALNLGGELKTVTVMFADVVGFSALAEVLPPQTVVALLNELFTFATEIVHRRGGMIDKFIGDAVMAVWGVPDAKADDSQQAVAAAEELRRWVETGNRRWQQKWGVELQVGIGIHCGAVVAGNIGSERRMDYTIVGDVVNVAARLEATAAAGQILISDATRRQLADTNVKAVGSRALGGRSETTDIFEVGS